MMVIIFFLLEGNFFLVEMLDFENKIYLKTLVPNESLRTQNFWRISNTFRIIMRYY